MSNRLELTRSQILRHRIRTGSLGTRLPFGTESLRRAAWAGLSDSMPRGALFSLHARVEGIEPDSWEHPSLVQVWGPRFSAYVVPEVDAGVFTLGRLSDRPGKRQLALDLADRLDRLVGAFPVPYGEAARALGENHNQLRYAAPTGRVRIRWDGARQPTIWTVPPPTSEPTNARLELARRYLNMAGPSAPESFARWAGVTPSHATATFNMLEPELMPVDTPIGERLILESDRESLTDATGYTGSIRLLPSGDIHYLCWGDDRRLLLATEDRRAALWTSRVWPGAVLVDEEIVGIWRRTQHRVRIELWDAPGKQVVEGVAEAAQTLPVSNEVTVDFETRQHHPE